MDKSESLFQKQRVKRFNFLNMDGTDWDATRPNELLYGMAFSDCFSL